MSKPRKKRGFKKKRYVVPVIVIVLLIAFRIALPYIVKNYVNKTLADIPGYYGHVEDIDMALYRGAYVIDGLVLEKVDAGTNVPFLDFKKTDISIQWDALFDGRIVSEIEMFSPTVNYIFEDQQTIPEEGEANLDNWTDVLTDLVPIDINHLEVHDGKVAFSQLSTDPNIDLYMDQIHLNATNLRNVKQEGLALPSSVTATGVSIGQGATKLDGKMNLVKEIPDMDLNFSLEKADVTALNNLTRHYAGIDFEEGDFELFGEIAIANSYLKGYIKPLLRDSKMVGKEDGVLGVIWEGFVGFFKFILRNQNTKAIATEIPIEGDLSNVEAGLWSTVFNIIKNAWIEAFTGELDDNIEFSDAFKDGEVDKKAAHQQRREERQEKRKEKRAKDEDTDSDTSDDGWFGGSDDGSR